MDGVFTFRHSESYASLSLDLKERIDKWVNILELMG